MPNYQYKWVPAKLINDDFLKQCSELYSNHYGVWSTNAPFSPGQRIRLSSQKLREWTQHDDARIALALHGDELVGYAIAIQTKLGPLGLVSWVTQLVVHETHRNLGVGKQLLFSIWGFSNHFAWGLVSANPYAVRALEKATRRRCSPTRISRNYRRLKTLGQGCIPYVKRATDFCVNSKESRIKTNFYLDHSTLNAKISRVTSVHKPWALGNLMEGWEWFAFTFNDQSQISLDSAELENMLLMSDNLTRIAYSRMQVGDHPWARHTDKEVREIVEYCGLQSGQSVVDFGCGLGRHAIELSKRGFSVKGVDYLEEFVIQARTSANGSRTGRLQFIEGDCRNVDLAETFDAVICLYDVIGTYAGKPENEKILRNMYNHLKPGGKALISVMNATLTRHRATQWFSLRNEPDRLLTLTASQNMEKTGDIFDPQYYMIDRETGVIYRKEQFAQGSALPTEIVIRDRRFDKSEIEQMCRDANLKVLWSRCVQAGLWDRALKDDDSRAKEILVLCERDR